MSRQALMRVLHVLHTSLPVLCGYSIRSDYILRNQRDQGIDVAVVTSAQHAGSEANCVETMDGIHYYRTRSISGPQAPLLREWRLMRALKRRVQQAVREFRPHVIHAHSPVIVGLPALTVSRRAAIPLVYEVRDLWENASVDRGKFGEHSLQYKIARYLETRLMNRAHGVITICQSLRNELATRVLHPERLYVIDNGVNAQQFKPRGNGDKEKQRRGLGGTKLFGYVGTFQPYEGLETLIAAMPTIVKCIPNAQLVITGSGGVEAKLRAQVDQLELHSNVTFTGRVPHDEVRDLYAMMDLLVYPRIYTRTTSLTTPLKPLEAMAMAKPVLVSDVPAMQELVTDGITGRMFRAGDVDDLGRQVVRMLGEETEELERMGRAAREWILKERQWCRIVARYNDVYQQMRKP